MFSISNLHISSKFSILTNNCVSPFCSRITNNLFHWRTANIREQMRSINTIHLEKYRELYQTFLSYMVNLRETICLGPWMAACAQYSLTCWSIFLQTLTKTILFAIPSKRKNGILQARKEPLQVFVNENIPQQWLRTSLCWLAHCVWTSWAQRS